MGKCLNVLAERVDEGVFGFVALIDDLPKVALDALGAFGKAELFFEGFVFVGIDV